MSFDVEYPDPLLDLQDQVRDRLLSLNFFAGRFSVLSDRPKTIGGRIAKLTAKYEGIYAAVLTTEGKATEDILAGPESQVFVDVAASELTTTNRTGTGYTTATAMITQIIRGLHYWKPGIAHERLGYVGFRVDEADKSANGLLIMTARFKTVIRFPEVAATEIITDDFGTLATDDVPVVVTN